MPDLDPQQRRLSNTITVAAALSVALAVASPRISSWRQRRRRVVVAEHEPQQTFEACRSLVVDHVHAAPGLRTCAFLNAVDVARLRRCQRDLVEVLEPRCLLPSLARMGLGDSGHGMLALRDVFAAPLAGHPHPTCCDVIQASFNEAVRGGGDLQAVLSKPDSQGRMPVQIAVHMATPRVLKALLSLGAPADVSGKGPQFSWSPLMYAISVGDRESASLLVKHGASVNFVETQNYWTPLLVAVANNHVSIVEWLLDCGADPGTTIGSLRVNRHIDDCRGHMKMLEEIMSRRRVEGRGRHHYAPHGARGLGRA